MISRLRLLFRLGPMMPPPQPARPVVCPSSSAHWLALATRDAALRARPAALWYHARRSVHRPIRVGRAAGAGCVDVGVSGGYRRGAIWWEVSVSKAVRGKGWGDVPLSRNRLRHWEKRPPGAGRHRMAGALVEWFRRNGIENRCKVCSCSCMMR